ncbi:MAG: FAD-binding oxidoreductase [Dehalococcoidia bacterium]
MVFVNELLPRLIDALGENAINVTPETRELRMLDALGASRGGAAAPAQAPLVVVRPAATDEVTAVMRIADELRAPVVPYGGGTGLMGGARSVRAGIVLDLGRMDRVREADAASGWAWVEAGAVLADADRELAAHGVMLGHDPWTYAIATVGGTLSTNGLGFLGGKYGSMGEQVLAVEAVLADGTVLRTRPAGPHSAAPDLTRLFVAGEGCFGVVTAAALRVFPLPEARVRIGYTFASFEAGFAALLRLQAIGLRPALLDYGERPAADGVGEPPTLYLGFEGFREEAEAQRGRAAAICADAGGRGLPAEDVEAFWAERHVPAERFARARTSGAPVRRPSGDGSHFDYVHVALPASAVLDYRQRALATAAAEGVRVVETGIWVAPGLFSMVMVSEGAEAMGRAVDGCLRLAHACGGSMEYCHGAGVRLAHLMEEEHGAAGLEVLRRIKRAVDPNGILNPGKLGLD